MLPITVARLAFTAVLPLCKASYLRDNGGRSFSKNPEGEAQEYVTNPWTDTEQHNLFASNKAASECEWLDDFGLMPLFNVCEKYIACLEDFKDETESISTAKSAKKSKKSKKSKNQKSSKSQKNGNCTEHQRKAEKIARKYGLDLPDTFPYPPSTVPITTTTTSKTTTTSTTTIPDTIGVDLRSDIEENVPEYVTRLLSVDVYDMMVNDSPQGFVDGTANIATPTIDSLESTYESDMNRLVLEGTFEQSQQADDGESSTVIARVYSFGGLVSTSAVNPDGFFSIGLTDIPQGHNPYFIAFTSTSSNDRRHLSGGSGLPDVFWVMNDMCPAQATFKLTWKSVLDPTEGTSDLDLHVYEPGENGEEVYYSNKQGQYCELDFDDTQGFGPEHVYCNNPDLENGSTYTAKVHLFHEDMDTPPFQYQLEFYESGTLFRVENGVLPNNSSDHHWSPGYEVDLSDTSSGSSTCSICSTLTPETYHRSLYQVNYCSMCEPPRFGFWCSRLSWLCDESDELASYKLYKKLQDLDPTEENLKFYVNALLLPLEDAIGSEYVHADVLNSIEHNDGACIKQALNNAFCAIVGVRVGEAWMSAISSFNSIEFDTIVSMTTSVGFSAYLSTLDLDYITTVYNAYASVTAVPAIADGFYGQVVLC